MLKFLIRKEFSQLRRDRKMIPIIFMAPVLQLIIFGYAAQTDVKNIPTVICDYDKTPKSREFAEKLMHNGYFAPAGRADDAKEIDGLLINGKADIAVVISKGFADELGSGGQGKIQIILNGTDSNAAGVGLSYMTQIITRFASGIVVERMARVGAAAVPMASVEDRIWHNPELRSRNFMVPAILGMILMVMTMMLTSMAIVKEKEIGTIEQLVVTPVKSYQIIIGKLLPFVIIGAIDVFLILMVARYYFLVPIKGSIITLAFFALLFLVNTLGIGLLVSTVAATQQQAMMIVMFFIMMPFIYLSGFVFPVENMPKWVQPATAVIPLRWFLVAIRGIFLKGVGLESLCREALWLAGLGICSVAVAVARFKKRI